MKRILVIGAYGQIGTELTLLLREIYGINNVIASDIKLIANNELSENGIFEQLDVLNYEKLANVVSKHRIKTIYNLAAILSVLAEENLHAAWNVGINGLYNVLEVAREYKCSVFFPSSIAVFGENTPRFTTPEDTIMRPSTIYGISKVTGELLCDYYYKRFGVDTRGIRYPGIVSYMTQPGGGTTDYSVDIFFEAIKFKKFICPLKKDTTLDMLYMPDAINAAVTLMEANPEKLKHRNAFNITALNFSPELLAKEIKKHIPDFAMYYHVEPVKQKIADTWPRSVDDNCARNEWGWNPKWNLQSMTKDMLDKIKQFHKDTF